MGLSYPEPMPRISPTMEGFRAAFRWPLLTFAEITWRWAVGATATVLLFFGLVEYLKSLPVTRGELLFLRSGQPYLIGQAILHILRGSLSRAVLSLTVAILLMMVVWIVAGALGRIATVRAMIEYFAGRFAQFASPGTPRESVADAEPGERASPFESLMFLNLLRVALALAAILGFIGAIVVGKFASPDAKHPGLAFFIFLPIAGLVAIFWLALNWLLSLAAVFIVRDREDALSAISTALGLFRERTGAVLAVSSWVGIAHLVIFVAGTTVVSMPLGLIPLVPWRLALLAMIVITLAYFAVADWLYVARLAGYVCIAEMTDDMFAAVPPPLPPSLPPLQTTVDRNEVILSDIPALATDT